MPQEESNAGQSDMPEERFRYIGFEVFPSKVKDLYKSDDERKSLVERVRQRLSRSEGEVRERCTLLEERVTHGEKIFLTVVSILLVASFFLPWFSGYFENIRTEYVAAGGEVPGALTDSTEAQQQAIADTTEMSQDTTTTLAAEMDTVEEMIAADTTDTLAALKGVATEGIDTTNLTAVTKIDRDHRSITGLSTLAAIGSYGGMVFSSGILLVISGVLLLLFMLSCLVLAGVNLYALYGIKKSDHDEYALELKKWLRFNWIPVFIWLAIIILSFFGADYGFASGGMVKQVGDSYNFATLIGLSSYGMYLALGAFLVAALKGKEI